MKSIVRAVLVLTLCLGAVHLARADEKTYNVQDLQALDESKSWQEILAHVMDVHPAQRTSAWNHVVEDACLQPGLMDADLAQQCAEPLKAVLISEPQNQAFAWKAAKWARVNLAASAAVPFFSKALTKANDPRCKDEDVSLAVVAGLELPHDDNKDIVAQSQKLAFHTCWPQTKTAVLKDFADGNSYFSDNTCSALKQKGALSADQSKMCAGHYK